MWGKEQRYESLSWRQLPHAHNCSVGPGQYSVQGSHRAAGAALWATCAETDAVEARFRLLWAPRQVKLRCPRPQSAMTLSGVRRRFATEREDSNRRFRRNRPVSAVRPQSALRRPASAMRGGGEEIADTARLSTSCARQAGWRQQHLVQSYCPVRRGARRCSGGGGAAAFSSGLQLRIEQAISRRINIAAAQPSDTIAGGKDEKRARDFARRSPSGAAAVAGPTPSMPPLRPQSPGVTDADLGIYDDAFENESEDDYSQQFAALDLNRTANSPSPVRQQSDDVSTAEDTYGADEFVK